MSGFLSSKYLKYRNEIYRRPIDKDLLCPTCGYNVRGLNYGRACPECGTPIEPAGDDDILLTGGASRRHAWRIGFGILFLCLVGAVGARLMMFVLGLRGFGDGAAWAYLGFGLVLSCLWVIAAWLLTPAALGVRFMFMGTLRWVVRFSQLLWPLGYMCWMTGFAESNDRLIMWGQVLRLGAGVGALLLAVMLTAVAYSAQREDVARRLRATVWLLPIATLLAQGIPSSVAWIFLFPIILVLLLWAWMMMLYALAVGELYRHVRWGTLDARRLSTREQRVAETRRGYDRALEASVRPPPPSQPDIPMDDE